MYPSMALANMVSAWARVSRALHGRACLVCLIMSVAVRVLSCALLLIRVAQVHSFAVSSCVFGCCASAGACCLVAMPLRRIKGRMEPCGDTETDKSLRLTKLCP